MRVGSTQPRFCMLSFWVQNDVSDNFFIYPVNSPEVTQAKSIANFKTWFQKHRGLPKKLLFEKLNRKLLGYYNYFGVTGNFQSLNNFVYHVKGLFFKWLNNHSQRKSYNWKGFKELVKCFELAKPRILHAF